eukprot:CAMPEP_0205937830 /NCGR_PEP_ID=MMETSP1325-20131115/45188_1 /ASSEMBLY_ACC=CAM_ASM_000708 /TAXON_ID=236786 /ORGANISM="Florenciella sp., Strain RCC1007" /LENGTH=38 /DNA_ID= /DNA_START= /DNA_END= /DNA_ORIENTATION=
MSEVFTPAMFEELAEAMKAAGWEGVDEVAEMYTNEYAT